MPPTLSELLEQPFGPYPDTHVLAETLKSIPSKPLRLRSVSLLRDGEPTGLTYCEPYQPESLRTNLPVEIEGTLRVKSLDWLSPLGLETVQAELRARDGPLSTLTLRHVFLRSKKEPLALLIRITAVKNLTSVFLNSSKVDYGLFMNTSLPLRKYRWFEVLSMTAPTFKMSHKFLSRNRTLQVLNRISLFDKSTGRVTPLERRTPHWFAFNYLRFARHVRSEGTEMVHLSSDSDNDDDDDASRKVRPRIHRALYHRSRAQILKLLSVHAEWLVGDQQLRRRPQRCLDPDVWQSWISRVKSSRKRRIPESEIFVFGEDVDDSGEEERGADDGEQEDGVEEGEGGLVEPGPARVDVDGEGPGDDLEYGDPPVPSTPPNKKRKPIESPVVDKAKKRARMISLSSDDSEISGLEVPDATLDLEDLLDYEDHQYPVHDYDSDFSLSSDSDWHDSDASLPSRPPTPPPLALLKKVPVAFLHPPKLPEFSFKWDCPVDNCWYQIDLLKLTRENCKGIPRQHAVRLRDTVWKLDDDWVREDFYKMVTTHWARHLETWNIAIQRRGKTVTLGWKKTQAENGPVEPVGQVHVKEENS